jgi:hypothetical protein
VKVLSANLNAGACKDGSLQTELGRAVCGLPQLCVDRNDESISLSPSPTQPTQHFTTFSSVGKDDTRDDNKNSWRHAEQGYEGDGSSEEEPDLDNSENSLAEAKLDDSEQDSVLSPEPDDNTSWMFQGSRDDAGLHEQNTDHKTPHQAKRKRKDRECQHSGTGAPRFGVTALNYSSGEFDFSSPGFPQRSAARTARARSSARDGVRWKMLRSQ